MASVRTIYHNLRWCDNASDPATSAVYREAAQNAIADTKISLVWRQAIAKRLNQVNQSLARLTVGPNDSY
ncbi:MAG: hypothetical protein SAJ12_17785 [Jaaginema sp. PMC 1079.18]|nr:hypothetical protein [Jaaginema sp. PMC 1080.18]MEC4852834.1 hypothetical protein [Jaaginema sp. PMC 1079.18]MEC4864722.1 hypothetical protein [Jaaginema sp. PMC 1078.18]